MHYTGWTTDGKMFDSSVHARRSRRRSRSTGVIKGWTEGVQLMVVGEKRRLWIPAELAYGEAGRARPQGMLVFDVELLEMKPPPKPPGADRRRRRRRRTRRRPSRASRTRCSRRAPARSTRSATSTVEVHYTGWTTDGKMFDSSVARGEPATFPLDDVIAGWTEGVQLMVDGEKTRFWIPGNARLRQRPSPARPRACSSSTSSCSRFA